MNRELTIDDVLKASIGEASSEIRASFKKTVLVRQYETEVVELDTTLKLDKPVTGCERMLISALLQIQLEYTAYCQLVFKGMVTETEFNQRKSVLASDINAIMAKAEALLGRSLEEYIDINVN